ECSHSMRFKEARTVDPATERDEGRIETFNMSDLQRQAVLGCEPDQLICFGEALRNRLLDKNVNPCFEKFLRYLMMADCRSGYADCLDLTDEILEILDVADARPLGDRATSRFVDVADRNQLYVFETGVNPGVLLPEMAGADDRSFQPVCHSRSIRCFRLSD